MADGTFFPQNEIEALAMVYIKAQDLSNKSVDEIVRMYDKAKDDVKDTLKTIGAEKRNIRRNR